MSFPMIVVRQHPQRKPHSAVVDRKCDTRTPGTRKIHARRTNLMTAVKPVGGSVTRLSPIRNYASAPGLSRLLLTAAS